MDHVPQLLTSAHVTVITSSHNPTIKSIRALRHRKERDRTGTFLIEGIRIVAEAAESSALIQSCIVAPELLVSPFARDLVGRLRSHGIPTLDVSPAVFASLSGKEGPQGIAAVVRQNLQTLVTAVAPATGLGWVALDAVQDPGNLGTILRTADAAGATGVILLGHTTDPYDPAAVRASMGALFTQHIIRADFDQLRTWARDRRYPLIGTSDAAEHDYAAVTYQTPLVLLMGSEREGLSPEQQQACDLVVAIPMAGKSDSLNLAVATGVVLYQIFNQRRGPS